MKSKQPTAPVLPSGMHEIAVSGRQRLSLFGFARELRPRDASERRGLDALFREFDLEEIEAKWMRATDQIAALAQRAEGAVGEAAAAALAEQREINSWADKYTDTVRKLTVSELSLVYLQRQLDRLGEIFPGGVSPSGSKVPAGMPVIMSRTLSAVFDQVDRIVPPAPAKP